MRAFAFLRGINVGNRRPKKDELIAAVAGPEVEDVSTYQASGNLLFETDAAPDALEPVLEQRLQAALGYEVISFVRTLDELAAIVDEMPEAGKGEKHQVVFFTADPGAEVRSRYEDAAGDTDTLRWRERELVWTHVGGMMDSPLSKSALSADGPAQTMRTGNTIERLVAKFR